jgi:hypothetical protein
MGGRWSNSWELLKASWRVLRQHKQLVTFPIISGITMVVLVALLLIPASFFISAFHHTATTTTGSTTGTNTGGMMLFYLAYFVVYFIGSFVVIFFNTGLIACAQQCLRGEEPTFAYGWDIAKKNLGNIARWALVSATVGLILKAIRERGGIFGAILGSVIGFAWNMIVLFVIPVMIFQGFGVVDSVKESASLFRRKWGETLISNVSIGFVFGLLAIVGMLAIALAAFTRNIPLIIIVSSVALLYWIFLAIMHATLNGILATALYDYAITNQVPQGYDPERFAGAFAPRQTRSFFS